jgi:ABC-2 type transport system permease protein
MNIFKYEVKKNLLSTLIWIVSLGVFIFFYFSFFETFNNPAFSQLLDNFPDAYKKAFGMDQDLTTVLGYFSFVGSFMFLAAAIFSSNLGLKAVSVEERDLTADFLIPKPVTRVKITTAKLLAALTHMLIFHLLTSLVCLASIETYRDGQGYSFYAFILIMLGLLIFQLLFFTIGFVVSVLLKRLDSPLPFSLGLSIGLYVLYAFDTLIQDTFIKYLVPYDFFDMGYIVENEAFKAYGLVISFGFIVAGVVSGYILYNRRNIATAM